MEPSRHTLLEARQPDLSSARQLPMIQGRDLDAPAGGVVITDASLTDDAFTMAFDGLDPVQSYQLVRGDDLQNFGTVVDGPRNPSGISDTFIDGNPPNGASYYRLEQIP